MHEKLKNIIFLVFVVLKNNSPCFHGEGEGKMIHLPPRPNNVENIVPCPLPPPLLPHRVANGSASIAQPSPY